MPLLPLTAFHHVFEPFRGRSVGYVRVPGNVGDGLIEAATFQLFRAHGVDARVVDPAAGPGDVESIVVAGGGSMGGLYPACRRVREQALAWGRPVTVLPQTFAGPEDLPYARVYVREAASLAHRPDAVLAPDLALGLAVGVSGPPDRGEGVWLRADKEGRFAARPSSGDPALAAKTVLDYVRLAARYEHVITDRLHFAIAALLCGRRATLLPNAYHKNKAMYETWLRDIGCGWRDEPPPHRTAGGPAVGAAGGGPRLTFIIPCMGRLDHLRQSLPAALAQPGCRTVVVDYSCPDHSGDWAAGHGPGVAVVRVPGQSTFHLARARNLGAAAAATPWLCFLDADVVPAPGFEADVLSRSVAGTYYRSAPIKTGTWGLVVVSRADFDRAGGYDECYRGYGGEDVDLYDALAAAGSQAGTFPAGLVRHIPHADTRRTDHYAAKDLWRTVAVARAYRAAKAAYAARHGHPLPAAARPTLYDKVAAGVPAGQSAGDEACPDGPTAADIGPDRSA